MDTYFATLPSQKVPIFRSKKLKSHKEALTLPQLFNQIVKCHPHHLALRCGSVNLNYGEYFQRSEKLAKSFIKIGLERNGCVAIFADNCHKVFIAQLATSFAGGHFVCIHTTSSADAAYFILESVRANLVIVDKVENFMKISQFSKKLPHLKAIVAVSFEEPKIYSWKQLEDLQTDDFDEIYNIRLASIAPNECCFLSFTSGTTGNPKGVMLSHDNIIWNVGNFVQALQLQKGKEKFVSYLPLSHIAAQYSEFFIPITIGGTVFVADKNALSDSIVPSLRKFEPTIFFGVPRIFEKIVEKFPDLKNIGLNECRNYIVAGAPSSDHIMKLMPLNESYGSTEMSCLITLSRKVKIGSVGQCFEGCELKVVNDEIYCRGRNVFMGYINEPEKTMEVLDSDRWFKTGDLGRVDDDGFVYITGRLKELIITSGGEKIPFVAIENDVKRELSAISQAFLVGNKRKFIAMLITFKCKPDGETLTDDSLQLMSQLGLEFTKHHEICGNSKIRVEVQNAIDRVNEKSFSNAHKIKTLSKLHVYKRLNVVRDQRLKVECFKINKNKKKIEAIR